MTAKTMVLHARDDAVIPFSARRALGEYPRAEFVTLERRNHLLLENKSAWERVMKCTKEFLA